MTDGNETIEQLLSRRLDGDFTPDEQARLRKAMEASAEHADVGQQYDRLNRLLSAWRRLPTDLDWPAMAREVSNRIEDVLTARASARLDREIDPDAVEDDPDSIESPAGPRLDPATRSVRATEDLVRDWADSMPEVDWDAYKTRVSLSVRREAEVSSQTASSVRWRRAAGWLTPIAAAVALVVWWPRGNEITPLFHPESGSQSILVALDMPRSGGRISIVFDEQPAEAQPRQEPAPGGTAIAIGPSWAEIPDTADEAYYY